MLLTQWPRLASRNTSQHIVSQFPSPEIGRVSERRASSIKNNLGYTAGLTLGRVFVAAASQLVVIQ